MGLVHTWNGVRPPTIKKELEIRMVTILSKRRSFLLKTPRLFDKVARNLGQQGSGIKAKSA